MTAHYYPGINLQGLPPQVIKLAAAAQFLVVSRYGVPPTGRDVAAAHEAGHVVVMASLGDQITGAEVTCRDLPTGGKVWCGANSRAAPSPWPTLTELLVPEIELAASVRAISANLSGVAGEVFAGLWHPSSSIDEEVRALISIDAVAELLDSNRSVVSEFFRRLCLATLSDHKRSFDEVKLHLEKNRRLTRKRVSRMLSGIRKRSLHEIIDLLAKEVRNAA